LSKIVAELIPNPDAPAKPSVETISSLSAAYLADLKRRIDNPKHPEGAVTLEHYKLSESVIERFTKAVVAQSGNVEVINLTVAILEVYRNDLGSSELSHSSKCDYWAKIKAFLNWIIITERDIHPVSRQSSLAAVHRWAVAKGKFPKEETDDDDDNDGTRSVSPAELKMYLSLLNARMAKANRKRDKIVIAQLKAQILVRRTPVC
jgi:hypothetical protein